MRALTFRLLPPATLLTLASLLGACGGSAPPAAGPQRPALASRVVQRAPLPVERMVDGTVEAIHQATVSAQTGGRVVEILYDVNDVVPAGAVILRLKGIEQRAGQKGAEASLTEARARATEAATQYTRIADLYQQHVVTRAQYEQATANRDAAAARLAAAEAGLATANEGVGYTEVRAPYGGVVTQRLVRVGETVVPGTPLMTGLSLKDLRVNFNVPQSVLASVRRYHSAAVYIGTERLQSNAITIFPEAATTSGTFKARLDLPAGSAEVAPGMYVRVGLMIGEAQGLQVPATALVEHSEVSGVYVLDEHGTPSLRYVRPGHRQGDDVEILAGLAPGERVAVDAIAAAERLTGRAP